MSRRWAPILASVIGAMCLLPASAGAAPLSDCTAHHGTIVVVDFAHWDGPIVRGCGSGQASDYALLHAAGFTTAGDAHDGAGFVCRLGNSAFRGGAQYPTPSQEACINTPPANAYWSYWTAAPDQNRWTYSQLGAMSDVPKPGEIELWTFGGTNISGTSGSAVPRVTPNSLRPYLSTSTSSQTTTTTTATSTSTGSSPTTQTTTSHTTTTTKSTTTDRTSSRPKPTKRPHEKAHRGTTNSGGEVKTAPAVVAAKPTEYHASSGSAVPLIIGVCVAAALCGAAGWTAWRRRQYEN